MRGAVAAGLLADPRQTPAEHDEPPAASAVAQRPDGTLEGAGDPRRGVAGVAVE
jgi:hypothetical protein